MIRVYSLRSQDVVLFQLNTETLAGFDLSSQYLEFADLAGQDCTGTNFRSARLRGARLTHAALSHAVFRDSDLTGADLTGADLTGADLRGADLTGSSLAGADLSHAEYNQRTRWPCGFVPEGQQAKNDPDSGRKGGAIGRAVPLLNLYQPQVWRRDLS
jgi:hypothetical protein